MDITYLGHSSFKLKVANATLVTDPYNKSVGFSFPRTSADIVTISHAHEDHNNKDAVNTTARRDKPFIIDSPGEYEVGGTSVFGVPSFHDDQEGELRGPNTIFSILMEGISVVHLGDLGHLLKQSQLSELNGVDVLLCPVGGHYTIDRKKVTELINQLEPSILIPMHYKTPNHNQDTFKEVGTLEEFIKDFGTEPQTMEKLSVTKASLSEDLQLVVLESQT